MTTWTSEVLAPVPETGHIFETSWPLGSNDIDGFRALRPDGVVRYIQEAGALHLQATQMVDTHPNWIVRRTVFDVIEPITWPDDIRVRRWCAALSSRWCGMRVRMEGARGGLIETEGFWICMNAETMMPSRMSDLFIETIGTSTDNHHLRWKPWLTNELGESKAHPFPLRRSDIDHFKHLTNAAYWLGIYDVLDDHTDLQQTPHRYVIEYNKPIAAREMVEIHTSRADDVLDIAFVVEGDVRTRAALARL